MTCVPFPCTPGLTGSEYIRESTITNQSMVSNFKAILITGNSKHISYLTLSFCSTTNIPPIH